VKPDTLNPKPLHANSIPRALLLSQEAGWNQISADWAVFFAHGTVLGFTVGDRLVATAAALPYGNDFGWISMVLVTAEYRHQGLAHRLVAACVSVLRDNGCAALLDAAPAATGIYAALGFIPLGKLQRWEGNGVGGAGASADLALDCSEVGSNLALDRLAFGADRGFLLEDFLSRTGSRALHSPHGFAILRRGSTASHLGPIVAEPGEAHALVAKARQRRSGKVIFFIDKLRRVSFAASREERERRIFSRALHLDFAQPDRSIPVPCDWESGGNPISASGTSTSDCAIGGWTGFPAAPSGGAKAIR